MKKTLRLSLRIPPGIILAGLAGWAWAAPLVSRAAGVPAVESKIAGPIGNVVVETRSLGTSYRPYAVMKSGRQPAPNANGCILLIYFPQSYGVSDNPAPTLANWTALVSGRSDIVVATAGNHNALEPTAMITEIIDDTVARDHVNPKHVFIVAYDEGTSPGINLVGAHPELFAGLATIACPPSDPNLASKRPPPAALLNMPLYFADGAQLVSEQRFDAQLMMVKKRGYTKIATFRPDCGRFFPRPIFEQMSMDMMAFFDRMLAAKSAEELKEANIQSLLAQSLVGEKRSLANAPGSYLFLTHDQDKFPAKTSPTLLICLCDGGDTAVNFANNWLDLMKSHPEVVVAIPEATGGTFENPWGPGTANLVMAIIADSIARDHVNPRHIILVGAGRGAEAGGAIVGEYPSRFAGFADIGPDFPAALFTPALKASSAKLAIYYANTNRSHAITIPPATSKQLADFGFKPPAMARGADPVNLLVEMCDIKGAITPDQFKFRVTRLMRFFDDVLSKNDMNEVTVSAAQNAGNPEVRNLN